jgi:predicted RND superfamily exporter protein
VAFRPEKPLRYRLKDSLVDLAERGLSRYASLLLAHPLRFTLLFLAASIAGLLLASTLPLHTEFSWLLPDNQPSVTALHALTKRRPSTAVIEVGIASPDPKITERFASDLAARLRQRMPPELLREVDEDDAAVRQYIWRNRHLYASLDDLRRARTALEERIEKEHRQKNPLVVDLLDDETPEKGAAPEKNDAMDDLQARLKQAKARAERAPGYVGEEGRLRMLVVRFRFGDTEPGKAEEAIKILDATVKELAPARYHPELSVGYAGDPVTATLEHDLILHDVVVTTAMCLALVLLLLIVALRSLRAVTALSVTLLCGCAMTFGFTRLVVGHLNSSTAFLGSVVAGNGINFGIIHLSRYLEERRHGSDHRTALRIAFRSTFVPTIIACTAAATAYFSLIITSFRGFSEFGIIAGSGMAFCWLASYSLLPALVTLLEPKRSVKPPPERPSVEPAQARRSRRLLFGLALGIVLGTTALSLYGAHKLVRDPFSDDLRALRSRSLPKTAPGQWSRRLDAAFGKDQSGGFYIGTNSLEQVPIVLRAIAEVERDTPPEKRIFGKVDALPNFLPGTLAEQREKIEILDEIRRKLSKIEPRLEPGSEAQRLIADLRPPPKEELRPITANDLPPNVREAFTEADGRIGLLLAIHPGPGYKDASYRATEEAVTLLRRLPVPESLRKTLLVSGPEVIFVDMMSAVQRDGPRASIISLVLVLLLLYGSFGWSREYFITAFALFAGSFGMLGLMGLLGVQLNFLNYIAVPITIGIGVDYPYNVMARLRQDMTANKPLWPGLVKTGGAVVLCSLTTMIGYAVLLLSDTGAIQSFGTAAVLGEITSIIAAILIAPCLLLVWRSPKPPGGGESSVLFESKS